MIQRFGKRVLAGLALDGGDLQVMNFLGERFIFVAADERKSISGDLQEVEETGDVRNLRKFRFQLYSDGGRRDGVERRDLCPEFCPSISSKFEPIIETRNSGVVDQRFAADKPILGTKENVLSDSILNANKHDVLSKQIFNAHFRKLIHHFHFTI